MAVVALAFDDVVLAADAAFGADESLDAVVVADDAASVTDETAFVAVERALVTGLSVAVDSSPPPANALTGRAMATSPTKNPSATLPSTFRLVPPFTGDLITL